MSAQEIVDIADYIAAHQAYGLTQHTILVPISRVDDLSSFIMYFPSCRVVLSDQDSISVESF